MDDMKFVKPLILGIIIVVMVCFGAAYSYQNSKDHEEKVKIENESTDSYSEPIEVDENGVPTEKGYQQILEREQQDALDEEEEELLKEVEEAYEEDLGNQPVDDDGPNRRGW